MTFATTVPTFFIRLKPTSSIAKPACMNMTKQAATMTHTVSAATPAAWVAVGSSAARTENGTSAESIAIPEASPSFFRRAGDLYNDVHLPELMGSGYRPSGRLETCGRHERQPDVSCEIHEIARAVDIFCRVHHT